MKAVSLMLLAALAIAIRSLSFAIPSTAKRSRYAPLTSGVKRVERRPAGDGVAVLPLGWFTTDQSSRVMCSALVTVATSGTASPTRVSMGPAGHVTVGRGSTSTVATQVPMEPSES